MQYGLTLAKKQLGRVQKCTKAPPHYTLSRQPDTQYAITATITDTT